MEIFLSIISIFFILTVFLSLIKNDFWIYKVLEYPRLQKLVLIVVVTGCWFFFRPVEKLFYQLVIGGLIISIIYLIYKIWPYTILSKKEINQVNGTDPAKELKIFSANVLQDNEQYDTMLTHINNSDPDIIFLLETNAAWKNGMKELEQKYPYTLLSPLENTYGLLFYSRLKLENANVLFVVKNDIPSIEATVILRSGQKVQLWGLHPEPPVPGESLYSTAKDKELMKIAFKAKNCALPCIVLGDLNDVAWSHTTELFRKTSELLDPRRGRGFYNTFSAHHWYIRFPLDYIFCSKEFGLIRMMRMPKNGSDHFATLTHLAFREDLKKKQEPKKADKDELDEAKKLAAQRLKE